MALELLAVHDHHHVGGGVVRGLVHLGERIVARDVPGQHALSDCLGGGNLAVRELLEDPVEVFDEALDGHMATLDVQQEYCKVIVLRNSALLGQFSELFILGLPLGGFCLIFVFTGFLAGVHGKSVQTVELNRVFKHHLLSILQLGSVHSLTELMQTGLQMVLVNKRQFIEACLGRRVRREPSLLHEAACVWSWGHMTLLAVKALGLSPVDSEPGGHGGLPQHLAFGPKLVAHCDLRRGRVRRWQLRLLVSR